ncbi:MAG: cobalt-precorrin-5B (C(1))-methyltransferase CbiD [Atribacterota bacterium]|nr:cobalt-precorrin-5B (C(1))-methyltransferase CbiD [Atribacterota bacterium]
MKLGITTGTCASAAALGALFKALGKDPSYVKTQLPNGEYIDVEIIQAGVRSNGHYFSMVKKYAGDDPDITDGILIGASLLLRPGKQNISIIGGEGVGKVTKPGLYLEPGEWAINPVPKKQIIDNLLRFLPKYWDLQVEIFVPNGSKIATQTFNSELGIEGGISILGTTGRVFPMSQGSFMETIRLQIRQRIALGFHTLVLVPGNYGEKFAQSLGWDSQHIIRTSGYIGFALDTARIEKAKRIVVIGQVGKMVKIAGGIFNTHNEVADARREILFAHLVRFGLPTQFFDDIWLATTAEQVSQILNSWPSAAQFWDYLAHEIAQKINKRVKSQLSVEVNIFSLKQGLLGKDVLNE